MNEAQTIRNAVANVSHMRQMVRADARLQASVAAVKRFQARRFAQTYGDLAVDPRYQAATGFFLTELYGERDYDERDAQFAKVAGALQRLIPPAALRTAVSLSELHGLSERLAFTMGQAWLAHGATGFSSAIRYMKCWRTVSRRAQRALQLPTVLDIGDELGRLTKIGGLRLMLSAMRGPASMAGLESLQLFLESGFDAFKSLTTLDGGPQKFLELIRNRETRQIELLFDGTEEAVRTALQIEA